MMPGDDDQGVLLTRGSVRRIKRVVDRFDGAPPVGPAAPSGASPWNPGVQRARVTVAIPTGTESSPSSAGKVRLKVRNAAGAWVDGEEVQVHNHNTGATIPVGRAVMVAWIAGEWWLLTGSCA